MLPFYQIFKSFNATNHSAEFAFLVITLSMIAISKPEKNLIKNRYGGKKGYFSERLHLIHAKIQVEKKF